jgi:hypothetical protein
VNEVRRYSDKTIATAARRVHRAMRHITHKDLTLRDQLDMLVCQLIHQGLEPIDVARANGDDALVIIASALFWDGTIRAADLNKKPGWIVVDSYVSDFEIAPGKFMKLPVPKRVRTLREPSSAWQRVIDRVLKMPEKQTPP